jgi:hypothetical protein
MTGTVGDQTWRLGEAEKFKEGSIWKGNRRKGVRYTIDWGSAGAMNPAAPAGPANAPVNSQDSVSLNPGGTQKITLPAGYMSDVNPMTQNSPNNLALATNTAGLVMGPNNQPLTSDGSNMSWNSGNMPTLDNPNPAIAANQNLVAPASTDVINPSSEVSQVDQSAFTPTVQTETGVKGVQDGALVEQEYRRNKYDRQEDRENRRDARQEMISNVKGLFSGKRYEYGGNVDPFALENAVALINRAFGGRIPRAVDGMDLGSQDTNGNGIPDYLEAENFPANQPNLFDKSGTIEESNANKLNIDWNAAGDMYMNTAAKVTNFANRMNAMNPERDMAKFSALNRPSNTYDTMKQGLYDQAGNFIPNDIGNQVLNPTDTMYNNQRQIFAYGGRVYEIGGEVDLDDNEMEQLAAAGFKFSKV